MHGSPKQRMLVEGDASRGHAIDLLRTAAAAAERSGVTYCIEALASGETDFVNTVAEAAAIAAAVADGTVVGDPKADGTHLGPVVSDVQYGRIQHLIETALGEGCELVAGGAGKPEGLTTGYYVRPTVFANVGNDMTIAREEVFGPVLSIIGYRDEDDAVAIANDTPYGLSGYVQSGDPERARRVAARLRTGMVHINGAHGDFEAPFGGYKQSGNGREWGAYAFEDFLETKSLMGAA
ncbi:MAG: aldehyde dehydrogenase family protein [Pseudomonadota bacterium]